MKYALLLLSYNSSYNLSEMVPPLNLAKVYFFGETLPIILSSHMSTI